MVVALKPGCIVVAGISGYSLTVFSFALRVISGIVYE